MIHPATDVRPAGHLDLGEFATGDIPKGTLLWVLDRCRAECRDGSSKSAMERSRVVHMRNPALLSPLILAAAAGLSLCFVDVARPSIRGALA